MRHGRDDFNPQKVAIYNEEKINQLLRDKRIVRNRQKILATVHNAILVTKIQEEFDSFDNYIWSFANGKIPNKEFSTFSDLPSETEESKAMSKELKKRGFKFAGPKICYAFMQAVGIVNDHTVDCFRYADLS